MTHRVKSGGNLSQTTEEPLSVELYKMCLISPAVSCDQGSSLETWCPGCLVGTSHIAHTKIPDSQKENRCSAYTTWRA